MSENDKPSLKKIARASYRATASQLSAFLLKLIKKDRNKTTIISRMINFESEWLLFLVFFLFSAKKENVPAVYINNKKDNESR